MPTQTEPNDNAELKTMKMVMSINPRERESPGENIMLSFYDPTFQAEKKLSFMGQPRNDESIALCNKCTIRDYRTMKLCN